MPETITIGPVDNCGKIPYYAESCPGVLAVAYSSGAYEKFDKKITSTDLNGRCTSNFSGTSAAAPLAAGTYLQEFTNNSSVCVCCYHWRHTSISGEFNFLINVMVS